MKLSKSVLPKLNKRIATGKVYSNNYDTTGKVYHGFLNFLQGNSKKQI